MGRRCPAAALREHLPGCLTHQPEAKSIPAATCACRSLQCGDGCTVRAAGTLPAALAAGLSACTTIDLQNQAFAGPLPPDWGDRPGALPALQNL